MFCSILAIPNKDIIQVFVDNKFLPLFFGDDDADNTFKYLDVTDVLFFLGSSLFKYNLVFSTFGWKVIW